MSEAFSIQMTITSAGMAWLSGGEQRRVMLVSMLSAAMGQGLTETANHIKIDYVRGGNPKVHRGGATPHAVRSGALLQSIGMVMDAPLEGRVGSFEGPASKYAKVVLGDQKWTIEPKQAGKHLWVPIADNLGSSGQMRMSPREAMGLVDSNGKRRLRIFTSKKGNLVAFLPDDQGGIYRSGQKKGLSRGKLLFVLKDSVQVQGSDAVGKGFNSKLGRIEELLQGAMDKALTLTLLVMTGLFIQRLFTGLLNRIFN